MTLRLQRQEYGTCMDTIAMTKLHVIDWPFGP